MGAFHIEPLFLLVDIQPVCVPILQSCRDTSSAVVTKLRHLLLLIIRVHRYAVLVSRADNAMPSYWIRQARRTHSINDKKKGIEQRKIWEKSKKSVVPPKYVEDNTTNKQNEQNDHIKTDYDCQPKERTGKSTHNKPQKTNGTLQAAPAVSRVRLLQSVWYLAILPAVSFLLSITMPHPRRGCVRRYKNKQDRLVRHLCTNVRLSFIISATRKTDKYND